MAGLGINIRADFRRERIGGRESVKIAVDKIIKTRLGQAVERIQRKWPVDTGLSKRSFKLVRRAELLYELVNDATVGERARLKGTTSRTPNNKYAGYVRRRKGAPLLTQDLVKPQLDKATDQIREDITKQLPALLRQSVVRATSTANIRRTTSRLGRIRI